jgi:hypothetical protein
MVKRRFLNIYRSDNYSRSRLGNRQQRRAAKAL